MSNEVEIKVKSTDKTDFTKIKSKAKTEGGKAGDDAGKEFSVRLGKSASKGAAKGGEDGGKSFGKSLRKWFVGDGSKLIGEGGQITGESFKSGFSGILKTPVVGPIVVGALAGAAAIAGPAAGSIAAGGLILGFGAGLAGLGLVLASKSKVVEDKWSSTMKRVGEKSKLMATPFESTLTGIADIFERTFDDFAPTLTSVFGKMATPVRDFADDTGRALEGLTPALGPVADAANAVLKSFGPGLQDMIGKTADGLRDLAASVKANPDALADTARGAGDLLQGVLGLTKVLNDANGEFERLTGGTSAVDAFFGGVNSLLVPVTATFQALNWALGETNKLTKPVGDGYHYTAVSAEEAANTTEMWTQGLSAAQLAAMGVTGASKDTGGEVESLAEKFNRQKSKTDALIASLFQLQNGYLNLSGSQISYERAVDAATKSVKENGRTLDISTAKGQNNMESLNQLAQATNGQTESMIRNNKGLTAAYKTAATARQGFVKLAQQMGATKPQAEAMAKSMIAIPNVSRRARLTADKKDLESKLAAAKKQLADKNLTKERRAQISANIASLQSQIRKAQAAINGLHGKTVINSVVTRYSVRGSVSSGSGVGGGHEIDHNWKGGPVRRMASGGNPLSARQFVAGEYGAELVDVDGTGNVRVTPAGNTARRLGQQPAGGVQEVRLVLEGRGDVGDFLIKMLQPAIRNRGGNLNVILAGKAS